MTSQPTVYVLVLLVVGHLGLALAAAVVEAAEAATAAAAAGDEAAEYSQELRINSHVTKSYKPLYYKFKSS